MTGAQIPVLSFIVIERYRQTGPDYIQFFSRNGEITFKQLCEIVF